MNNNNLISSGLLELYLMGMTSLEESEEVELLVAQNPTIKVEFDDMQKAIESYAIAHGKAPGEHVKEKIFKQINSPLTNLNKEADVTMVSAPKVIGISSFWKYAAAASIILLIGSIALNIIMYDKYNTSDKQLNTATLELNKLQESNKDMSEEMNVYQSKYSEPVSLHGMEPAPDANAKVIWMKNSGEVYIDPNNLPETPVGKQYQLWAIVAGKPISAGMVTTTKDGKTAHVQKMKTFGKVDAFAVTLEAEKDNVSPKGPMYAMGKMQ